MAQESPDTVDALYDFIYLDRPRIASYSAQFDDSGVLTSAKVTSQSTDTSGAAGTVGIPHVASGSLTSGGSISESIERQFDAQWTIPLNVIDQLADAGMIHSSLSAAKIGSIAIFRGSLQIVDIRMLKTMWKSIVAQWIEANIPSVPALPPNASSKQRQEHRNLTGTVKNLRAQVDSKIGSMADIISALPHPLQATLSGDYGKAWCVLDAANLTTNPDAFALQHGGSVAGSWTMLAVIDALPDSGAPENPFEAIGENAGVVGVMTAMQDILRQQFGRPAGAYGVTPIAIYRSVEKVTKTAAAPVAKKAKTKAE